MSRNSIIFLIFVLTVVEKCTSNPWYRSLSSSPPVRYQSSPSFRQSNLFGGGDASPYQRQFSRQSSFDANPRPVMNADGSTSIPIRYANLSREEIMKMIAEDDPAIPSQVTDHKRGEFSKPLENKFSRQSIPPSPVTNNGTIKQSIPDGGTITVQITGPGLDDDLINRLTKDVRNSMYQFFIQPSYDAQVRRTFSTSPVPGG